MSDVIQSMKALNFRMLGGGGDNNREKWIDVLKCIAIVFVIIDHTNRILYTNQDIAHISYCAVSIFVFLSGVVLFESNNRIKDKQKDERINWAQITVKRVKKILIPYIIAVFVYVLVIYHYFDFDRYLKYLFNFNVSGPHYYILLYIQLLIICPILYCVISKINQVNNWRKLVYLVIFLLVIVIISYLTTNYTNIHNVYGGGGRLFGGSFLLVFSLGMLFKVMIDNKIKINNKYVWILVFFILLALLAVYFSYYTNNLRILDYWKILGNYGNPPVVSNVVYALLFILTVYSFMKYIETVHSHVVQLTVNILCKIGEYTLYIFLYHRLFLDFMLPQLTINGQYVKIIIYFAVMILGSMTIGFIEKQLISTYKKLLI